MDHNSLLKQKRDNNLLGVGLGVDLLTKFVLVDVEDGMKSAAERANCNVGICSLDCGGDVFARYYKDGLADIDVVLWLKNRIIWSNWLNIHCSYYFKQTILTYIIVENRRHAVFAGFSFDVLQF